MATVLILDDDLIVARALGRTLRRAGYLVHLIDNPEEAWLLKPPDVVISDHWMPGMTGLQFLQGARERWPDALRLMCSGLDDDLGATAGTLIHGWVAKPWDDGELLGLLGDLLGGRRAA